MCHLIVIKQKTTQFTANNGSESIFATLNLNTIECFMVVFKIKKYFIIDWITIF